MMSNAITSDWAGTLLGFTTEYHGMGQMCVTTVIIFKVFDSTCSILKEHYDVCCLPKHGNFHPNDRLIILIYLGQASERKTASLTRGTETTNVCKL